MATKYAPHTMTAAAARAKAKVGKSTKGGKVGQCLAECVNPANDSPYDIPSPWGWGGNSKPWAINYWLNAVAKGKVVKTSDPAKIPEGALAFMVKNADKGKAKPLHAGHVFIGVELGSGDAYSTDQPRGKWGKVSIRSIESAWGMTLVGYILVTGDGYDLRDKPKPAPKPDPQIAELTVRSMNLAAKAKLWQRQTWDDRLPHIRRALAAGASAHTSGAAIIGLQEAGSAANIADLKQEVFFPLGYLLAPRGGRWRYLIYDPRQVRCLVSGHFGLGFVGKYAAWGLFQDVRTGKELLVTSSHLIEGWASTDAERKREARKLLAVTKTLNLTRAPEVHVGDFNSYSAVSDSVFKPAGYKDAITIADHVTDGDYDSFNGRTGKTVPTSLPKHGNHLDHIEVSNGIDVVRWDLNPAPDASDHNTIAARIRY